MDLYLPSNDGKPLRQCEVLEGLREFRFDVSGLSLDSLQSSEPPSEWVIHPWTIVLSPECDLEWDYKARQGQASKATKLISHIILCDLEDASRIRPGRVNSSRDFERVIDNREERFHHIPANVTGAGHEIAEFFIDFKGMFSVPANFIYGLLELDVVKRHGVLKPPWAQHLAHRFTYFLGRVGLPELE